LPTGIFNPENQHQADKLVGWLMKILFKELGYSFVGAKIPLIFTLSSNTVWRQEPNLLVLIRHELGNKFVAQLPISV
jgi:hypothetical protein